MFFKKLQYKKNFRYKVYLHKLVIKPLKRMFKVKASLQTKIKKLNQLLYKIKKLIRKQRIIKIYKHLYKLKIFFPKKIHHKPTILTGLFQRYMYNHITSKGYTQNKKKTIFVLNRYKLNPLKINCLVDTIKSKKLLSLN